LVYYQLTSSSTLSVATASLAALNNQGLGTTSAFSHLDLDLANERRYGHFRVASFHLAALSFKAWPLT